MSCGYQSPETYQEKCARQYKMAKEIYRRLAGPNSVQLVLQEHIVCLINGMGCISIQIGVKDYIFNTDESLGNRWVLEDD